MTCSGSGPANTATGRDPKYWMRLLSEIKNRGVNDVCIVVCDGLKELPAAIETVWPQAIT